MSAVAAHVPAAGRPRLAFIGLGWIGRLRLDALSRESPVQVAACVDNDLGLARDAARAHAGACALPSLEACFELPLDGVVIATPSGLHESQASMALEHGLAVFCQKPLATSAAGAERVVARAAAADRLLGADFCYRHVNGMQTLRERLRERAYGDVQSLDLTFHNAYAPNAAWSRDVALAGGGCLLDLGIHLVDLAAWLQDFPEFEVEHARLYAGGRPLAPHTAAIEDLALAQLRQQDGACVRLGCSWNLHAGQGARIELVLYGTRGGVRWRNVRGSFYDFELSELRGDRSEVLAGGADDWGPRALQCWSRQLAHSRRFDTAARGYTASARLVEAIYARGGRA
jgi:predicted dehydrogenase